MTTIHQQTTDGITVLTDDRCVIDEIIHAAMIVEATVFLSRRGEWFAIRTEGGNGWQTAPVPGGTVTVGKV